MDVIREFLAAPVEPSTCHPRGKTCSGYRDSHEVPRDLMGGGRP